MRALSGLLGKAARSLLVLIFMLLGMVVASLQIVVVMITLSRLAPQVVANGTIALAALVHLFCGGIGGAKAGAMVWEWLRTPLADD